MRDRLLVIIGIALIGLTGCNSTMYDVGTTPVTLSPAVAAAFEKYKNSSSRPIIFVIDTEGKTYSYSSCAHTRCTENLGHRQIQSCESRAKKWGAKCKVFALTDQIAWKGPVFYSQGGPDQFPLTITRADPDGPGSLTNSGTAKILADNNQIFLKLYKGSNKCEGTADKRNKRWQISCDHSISFSGTFVESSKNLYEGIGKNAKEETVDFTIYRKPSMSNSIVPLDKSASVPAALSASRLCKFSLDAKSSSGWSTAPSMAPYVIEVLRRRITQVKCQKYIKDAA
jgi:hypothetical protein